VLPAEEIGELRELLAAVSDTELRQELETFLMQQARLTRARKLS